MRSFDGPNHLGLWSHQDVNPLANPPKPKRPKPLLEPSPPQIQVVMAALLEELPVPAAETEEDGEPSQRVDDDREPKKAKLASTGCAEQRCSRTAHGARTTCGMRHARAQRTTKHHPAAPLQQM